MESWREGRKGPGWGRTADAWAPARRNGTMAAIMVELNIVNDEIGLMLKGVSRCG